MNKILKKWIMALVNAGMGLSLFCLPAVLAADLTKDLKGSKDIPGLPRYEGSVISGYRLEKFSEAAFPLGKWMGTKGWEKSVKKQGRRTRIIYLAPPERSCAEVMLNYRKVLTDLGYAPVFECSGYGECGQDVEAFYNQDNSPKQLSDTQLQEFAFSKYSVKDPRIFTGKAIIKEQDSHVFVFAAYQDNYGVIGAGKRVALFLEEIRARKMEEKMVTLAARDFDRLISEKGRAAIYGIYFDTDKAVIKPESRPQLQEMAKYLTSHPDLNVYIVGHTDNQGSFDYNLDLSQRRAVSVVSNLTKSFGIQASRLTAKGIANLSPLASNDSDPGRAKNRRVEMVLK